MIKTTTDTAVIGIGTATQVYLQNFNLVLSALIGILTLLYAIARVRNEWKKGNRNDDRNV